MTTPAPKRRWYHLTPDRFFVGLLVAQILLLLSERFQWFAFNEKKGWTVLIAVAVVGAAVIVMLVWGLVCLLLRWRFQFSFRSLLLFLVVVSVPLGWFAWEMEKARRQREAVRAIRELRCVVFYDNQVGENGRLATIRKKPTTPAWLRKLLGDDFFCEVVEVFCAGTEYGDDDARHLKGLTRLEALALDGTQISDAGLEHLAVLTNLEYLYLRNTQVSDEGVAELQRALPNCWIEH